MGAGPATAYAPLRVRARDDAPREIISLATAVAKIECGRAARREKVGGGALMEAVKNSSWLELHPAKRSAGRQPMRGEPRQKVRKVEESANDFNEVDSTPISESI